MLALSSHDTSRSNRQGSSEHHLKLMGYVVFSKVMSDDKIRTCPKFREIVPWVSCSHYPHAIVVICMNEHPQCSWRIKVSDQEIGMGLRRYECTGKVHVSNGRVLGILSYLDNESLIQTTNIEAMLSSVLDRDLHMQRPNKVCITLRTYAWCSNKALTKSLHSFQ